MHRLRHVLAAAVIAICLSGVSVASATASHHKHQKATGQARQTSGAACTDLADQGKGNGGDPGNGGNHHNESRAGNPGNNGDPGNGRGHACDSDV